MRIRQSLALALVLIASTAVAQQATPTTQPVYGISTIRVSKSNLTLINIGSDTFHAEGISLDDLLSNAYGFIHLHAELIVGLPAWANSSRYDITAKVSDADPANLRKLTSEQHQEMLRAFLQDRFHLQAHLETKTGPIYDLVIAKGGPKLKVSTEQYGSTSSGDSQLTGNHSSTQDLANNLAHPLGRKVVDKTGLTGRYDYKLAWASLDPSTATNDNGSDKSLPDIFTAIQELGLKLVPSKGPVETLVVDHIDPPTEN